MAESMHFDHGTFVTDHIDIEGYSAATVSSATTAAQSGVLNEGVYDLWCTADTYVKVAPTANDVTSGTGYLLRANNTVPFIVRTNSRIGCIMSTATGTLSYHRVR
jgi:hypothetical protein